MPAIWPSVLGEYRQQNFRPLTNIDRPTLMGANSGGNIADAGWQARVIETVLLNTFQIFDDD